MRRRTGEESVSVIVGTLLLILITVTAAAGLALMVSQIQKDEMNRQTHLNAVKNENVTILNVAFENNQTEWYGVQNSRNWSSVKLTLVNMNTDDVRVVGIAINDRYASNFTDKLRTDSSVSSRNVFSGNLTIPATKSKDVYIDFVANASDDPSGLIDYSQPQYFDVGNPQNIKVGTSLTNFFETTLKPPNALYKMSIESESLGTVQRDALNLDGAGSTADNSIVRWNWTIYDRSMPLDTISGNPLTNWTNQTFSGKTVRITKLNNTPNYWGTLTVTDSIGMSATSNYFSIPPDTQFNPPTRLQWDPIPSAFLVSGPDCPETGPGAINASCILNPSFQWIRVINSTLYDLNNNPIQDTPIVFSIDNNPNTPQNCFSIVQMAVNTGSNGKASTTLMQSNITTPVCPQSVTIHAQAGKLLSPTILIPGIS